MTQFNFNQFTEITIQSSNLAYNKIDANLSPGEKYYRFCNLLQIPLVRKEDELIYKLKQKYNQNNSILIPPGFKKKKKLKLEYKTKLPDFMSAVIGEEKTIVLELIDEMLFKSLGIHILESFLIQKNEIDIVSTFKTHTTVYWRNEISLAFCDLPHELEPEAIESGYVLEDLLRAAEQGKKGIQEKIINLKQAKEDLQFQIFMNEVKQKEEKRSLRHQFIKELVSVVIALFS